MSFTKIYKTTQAQYQSTTSPVTDAFYLVDNLGQKINENLLLNPDFKINQRGQSTYSTSNNNNIYCVDRWVMWTPWNMLDSTTRTVRLAYPVGRRPYIECTCQVPTSFVGIAQIVEDASRFCNQTVTFSVKCQVYTYYSKLRLRICKYSSGNSHSTSNPEVIASSSFTNDMDTNIISLTADMPILTESDTLIFLIEFGGASGSSNTYNIYWAKVEIGDTYTEFVYVGEKEELLKCQRYYMVIGKSSSSPYIPLSTRNGANANPVYAVLPNVSMRKLPTLDLVNYTPTFAAIWYTSTANTPVSASQTTAGALVVDSPEIAEGSSGEGIVFKFNLVAGTAVRPTLCTGAIHNIRIKDIALDAEL